MIFPAGDFSALEHLVCQPYAVKCSGIVPPASGVVNLQTGGESYHRVDETFKNWMPAHFTKETIRATGARILKNLLRWSIFYAKVNDILRCKPGEQQSSTTIYKIIDYVLNRIQNSIARKRLALIIMPPESIKVVQ